MVNLLITALSFVLCTVGYAIDHSPQHRVEREIPLRGKMGSIEKVPIRQCMEQFSVPALAIAVIDGGKVDWLECYTTQDQFKKLNKNTLFQVKELAQTVSALGTLRLVHEKKLDLDANVEEYLTTWKLPESKFTEKEKVTMRGMLGMLGGISVKRFEEFYIGAPLPNLYQVLNGLPPAKNLPIHSIATPLEAWAYSEGGYEVVEAVVQDISGGAFSKTVNGLVLLPLGLDHTFFAKTLPQILHPYAIVGFDKDGKEIEGGWMNFPAHAAGALWSSIGDLSQLMTDLIGFYKGDSESFLPKKLIDEMFTPSKQADYGLGVHLHGEGDALQVSQIAHSPGYCTLFVFFPALEKGGVVMCNSDNGFELLINIFKTIAGVYNWPNSPFFEKDETKESQSGQEQG